MLASRRFSISRDSLLLNLAVVTGRSSFYRGFVFFGSGFTHQSTGRHILEHTRDVETNGLLHSLKGLEHGSGGIPCHRGCATLAKENDLLCLAQRLTDRAGNFRQLIHHHFEHGSLTIQLHGFCLLADRFSFSLTAQADRLGFLLGFVELRIRLSLTLNTLSFSLEDQGVLFSSRLFTNLDIQPFTLDLDLLTLQLCSSFEAGQLGCCTLLLEFLANALLLDGVSLIGLGLFLISLDLVLRLKKLELLVLLGNGGLRSDLRLVAFLLGLGLGDGRLLLLDDNVLDGHGVDDLALVVREVLNGQVDDLKTHVLHIRHGGLDGFLRKLIAVLDQL